MDAPILLTWKDMNAETGLPDWLIREYNTVHTKVMNPEFPCYFGTNAERGGKLRYTYIERDSIDHLPSTLGEFLRLSRSHPRTRHALVLFAEPEPSEKSLDFYRDRFWALLQWLHGHDSEPWPDDVPKDPRHPGWEYCFAGEPMFVFSSTPAYQQRASRNLGKSLVLLFQPRRVFRGIEGGTPGGTASRAKIRAQMLKYDGMPHHPDMGAYGDPSSFEWKQFFLPDDNALVSGRCPFHAETHEAPVPVNVADQGGHYGRI